MRAHTRAHFILVGGLRPPNPVPVVFSQFLHILETCEHMFADCTSCCPRVGGVSGFPTLFQFSHNITRIGSKNIIYMIPQSIKHPKTDSTKPPT